MTLYFDWNATSPRHAEVIAAMNDAEALGWANPSSVHQAGRAARRLVEDAREELGRALSLSPRDILFTGGGTEANHLALSGAKILVLSRIEHPSIVAQAEAMAEKGTRVVFAQVDENGVVSPESVGAALDEALAGETVEERDAALGGFNNQNTPLVTLMAVNHETGVLQPVHEVARLVHGRGARLHVDAMQLVGKASLEMLLEVDSVSLAAHKFRGPKGIGALAFACGWTPLPVARGGAQERGLRPGTVDAAAVAGLAAAIRRLDAAQSRHKEVALLSEFFEQELTQRAAHGLVIHGAAVPRLGHVTNFRAEGWKGDELVAALDLLDICISSGSACSAGTAEPSPVIEAMAGRSAATGAVRVSMGEETTREQVETLLAALTQLGVLRPRQ